MLFIEKYIIEQYDRKKYHEGHMPHGILYESK